MRRVLLFLGPLTAAALAVACEDDPSGNPSTQFPEAGTFDSSRQEGDASLSDANPPDSSGPRPVTVVVTTRKGPKANVTVVFHDATGAVIESKKTGPDGKATSGTSPLPSMATAVVTDRELLTWTGVQAGDELPVVAEDSSTIATYDVSLPGLPDAGATDYLAYVGRCSAKGDGLTPLSVPIDEYCRGAGAVLAHADAPYVGTVAYAFAKNVSGATDGGTTAITTGPWLTPTDLAASVANAPAGSPTFKLSLIASGAVFPVFFGGLEGSTMTFRVPPGFADALNVVVTIPGSVSGAARLVGKRVAPTASIALDFAEALAEVSEGKIANAAAAPRRPTITWKGATTTTKGGVARLAYFPPLSLSPTRWTIVVPPGTTSVQAPAMPAGTLDGALPADDAGANAWEDDPEIVFADSDLLADYATFRKVQGTFVGVASQALEYHDVVLPQNGSLRITRYRFEPTR